MKPNKTDVHQIITALFFAAAILITSYFLKGSDYSQMATNFLITVWLIPFFYLINKNKKRKACCKNDNIHAA